MLYIINEYKLTRDWLTSFKWRENTRRNGGVVEFSQYSRGSSSVPLCPGHSVCALRFCVLEAVYRSIESLLKNYLIDWVSEWFIYCLNDWMFEWLNDWSHRINQINVYTAKPFVICSCAFYAQYEEVVVPWRHSYTFFSILRSFQMSIVRHSSLYSTRIR